MEGGKTKLLVVSSERKMFFMETVRDVFKKRVPSLRSAWVTEFPETIRSVRREEWDIIVIECSYPRGKEVVSIIRPFSRSAIIMVVNCHGEITDTAWWWKVGVDACVSNFFPEKAWDAEKVGDAFSAVIVERQMGRSQRAIFRCLKQNSGRVVLREELVAIIRGGGDYLPTEADFQIIQVWISKIRKALGPNSMIHTISGIGYYLGYLRPPDQDVVGLLRAGEVVLDPQTGAFWCGEKEGVFLTKNEKTVLVLLMQNIGRIVSQFELIEVAWGKEFTSSEVKVYGLHMLIAKLRKKINGNTDNHMYVQTVHGKGYCFLP